MCGIFAYFGSKTNAGVLSVEGLKKLEYRGYDSWGLALKREDSSIFLKKTVGKISDFSDVASLPKSSIAMGHSRWATHGGVTEANCHPHTSENHEVAVVHNGIIENYEVLRGEMKKRGHVFSSETDTEVIPHLIEENLDRGLERAVRIALAQLKGRFAVVVMSKNEENIIAARRGSPLIVGRGEGEWFVASDIPAFLSHTNLVSYLDDEEMVVINHSGAVFSDIATGEVREKRVIEIEWKPEEAEKGDFEHFMLKEILEQKETIQRAINQDPIEIENFAAAIRNSRGAFLIGCGTAGKVCHSAEYFFSQIAHRHTNFAPASEFPIYHHFLRPESLVIAVSQSGETADVLEAIDVAKKAGSKVVSLVNVEGSSIYRASDYSLLIKAGPEKAVASTKAATSQLSLMLLIAHAVAGKLAEGEQLLIDTAAKINDMLNPRYLEHIRSVAEKIAAEPNIYIIGKAANYPMALEAAIKIQEVSYIHAEGFAGGELKHGPIALIKEGVPCIALVANDEVESEILSNTTELKSRGGRIIGISPHDSPVFDEWIRVPDVGFASPIVNVIPLQILAYYLAISRGLNPDMPRNLAKSVTVK